MLFICYPKCSTCRKAKTWLEDHNISYELRDIKEENPTAQELSDWQKRSGLPLKKYFQHLRHALQGDGPEGQTENHD